MREDLEQLWHHFEDEMSAYSKVLRKGQALTRGLISAVIIAVAAVLVLL